MMENINPVSHEPQNGQMEENAQEVIRAMKAMSHEVRLMLLWQLSRGEKTVTELADLLELEQSTVSQQLARLRLEGIVEGRREGRTIHYRIDDARVQNLIEIICSIYCTSGIEQ